jgi:secondary thiamine-phosphate synthase enzyme
MLAYTRPLRASVSLQLEWQAMTTWIQKTIVLAPKPRGFHVITREVTAQLPELQRLRVGLCHLFLQHTSASLALNERVEPEVRADLETFFNRLVPENVHYTHAYEGSDDMPAHVKALLVGASLTIPVTDGRLTLGTWQGLYLCEYRNHGGPRTLVVTAWGDE